MINFDYIAILGPTGSGKTQYAISLAKTIPIEVISVDSVSVYQGLDIGSAKPTLKERGVTTHHLIDEVDLNQVFTVGDFVKRAQQCIHEIHSRGAMPVFCGGTMMYMHALCSQHDQVPAVDVEIEQEVRAIYDQMGVEGIYGLLQSEDPKMAEILHPNDQQRIQRALVVWRATNKSLCDYWGNGKTSQYNGLHYLLMVNDREAHREVIKRRTASMLTKGLIDEVRMLMEKYGEEVINHPAMRSIGYRQAVMHLCERLPLEDVGERINIATSQLVKKQMTWLNRWNFPSYNKQNIYRNGKILNIFDLLLDSMKK